MRISRLGITYGNATFNPTTKLWHHTDRHPIFIGHSELSDRSMDDLERRVIKLGEYLYGSGPRQLSLDSEGRCIMNVDKMIERVMKGEDPRKVWEDKDHPECMNCGQPHVWDWGGDVYLTPKGKMSGSEIIKSPGTMGDVLKNHDLMRHKDDSFYKDEELVDELEVFNCAKCGTKIGAMALGEPGAIGLARKDWPSWHNVDWEEHAYEGERRDENMEVL